MNTDMDRLTVLRWGRISMAVLFFCAVFLLIYAFLYYYAAFSGDKGQVASFLGFKSQVLLILPFILVVAGFIFGLWVHALYVCLYNVFPHFRHKPVKAMLMVITPVLNLVGIGLAFSKVVNYLDKEITQPFYEEKANGLKFHLVLMYAGIVGVLLTLGLSITLSSRFEIFTNPKMIIFNTLQFGFIVAIGTGLFMFIRLANDIADYSFHQKMGHG